MDNISAEDRSEGLRRDLDELEAAGLAVEMLDLRHTGAVDKLAGFDVVWVRGGNIFVLRRALADTGADTVLIDLLQRDAIVYGGYSAGPCVLGPDLTALAYVDDITPSTTRSPTAWACWIGLSCRMCSLRRILSRQRVTSSQLATRHRVSSTGRSVMARFCSSRATR